MPGTKGVGTVISTDRGRKPERQNSKATATPTAAGEAMLNADPKTPLNRAIFILLGVGAIAFGNASLRGGHLFYQNSWGGLVFGPFAILFGLVFILGALFRPNIFKS